MTKSKEDIWCEEIERGRTPKKPVENYAKKTVENEAKKTVENEAKKKENDDSAKTFKV